ncbi:MAG: hypothetical protein LBR12_03320 [Opitutaceae bacterium]|jgi:polyhydroxyalkanoate synthesis regulator phasin|nr:hypothetical protein [Opitutaceae bacterium]
MIDLVKKTLLAGVGAAVVSKEKLEEALGDFVRQGKLSAADAKIVAGKLAEQGRAEFEAASRGLSERIKEYTARSDAELASKVAALEARVGALEARLAEEQGRSSEP